MDLWLLTLEAEGRSPYTIKGYREHMRIVLNNLGERELNPFTVRAFLADYRKDHSPFSCRTICATLRSFLRFCVDEGLASEEILRGLKLPKVPEATRPVLSAGQLKALFAVLGTVKTALGLRNHAAVAILVDGGLRASELVSLGLDDLEDGAVRVRRSKSGRGRTVPIGRRASRALATYLALGRPRLYPCTDVLLVADNGAAWSRSGLQSMLKRLSRSLGFRVSPHMLRHTFTTQALRAGADLETLRRIGGWQDYKMLAVYAHLLVDDLKERHRAFSPLDRLGS
jgi:site-specific recombinase XerD